MSISWLGNLSISFHIFRVSFGWRWKKLVVHLLLDYQLLLSKILNLFIESSWRRSVSWLAPHSSLLLFLVTLLILAICFCLQFYVSLHAMSFSDRVLQNGELTEIVCHIADVSRWWNFLFLFFLFEFREKIVLTFIVTF